MLRRDDAMPSPGWRLLLPCAAALVVVLGGAALTGIDIAIVAFGVTMIAAVVLTIRFAQLRHRRAQTNRSADRRMALTVLGAFVLPVVLLLAYEARA